MQLNEFEESPDLTRGIWIKPEKRPGSLLQPTSVVCNNFANCNEIEGNFRNILFGTTHADSPALKKKRNVKGRANIAENDLPLGRIPRLLKFSHFPLI